MKIPQPDPWATMILFIAFAGLVCTIYSGYVFPIQKPNCHDQVMAAWEAGALSVVNYDRGIEGLPGFKSWKEFETYVKEAKSRRVALDVFFAELDKDRAERARK